MKINGENTNRNYLVYGLKHKAISLYAELVVTYSNREGKKGLSNI